MRLSILVLAALISMISLDINANDSTTINKASILKVENKENRLNNLNHSGEVTIKSSDRSFIEFALPSIIALIVGLMPFFAILIASKKQRIVAEKQINASKETIEEQINSSLRIAEMDFRKNVLSDNRQNWINELRNVISELLSLYDSSILNLNQLTFKEYERFLFLITKAEFMLNPEKDIDYINSIVDLKDSLFLLFKKEIETGTVKEKMEIVKNRTKQTLKIEWERVKKGE